MAEGQKARTPLWWHQEHGDCFIVGDGTGLPDGTLGEPYVEVVFVAPATIAGRVVNRARVPRSSLLLIPSPAYAGQVIPQTHQLGYVRAHFGGNRAVGPRGGQLRTSTVQLPAEDWNADGSMQAEAHDLVNGDCADRDFAVVDDRKDAPHQDDYVKAPRVAQVDPLENPNADPDLEAFGRTLAKAAGKGADAIDRAIDHALDTPSTTPDEFAAYLADSWGVVSRGNGRARWDKRRAQQSLSRRQRGMMKAVRLYHQQPSLSWDQAAKQAGAKNRAEGRQWRAAIVYMAGADTLYREGGHVERAKARHAGEEAWQKAFVGCKEERG